MGGFFSLRATARFLLAICFVALVVSARGHGDPLAECLAALARVNRPLTLVIWEGDAAPSIYQPARKILEAQKARLSPEAYARFERWYLDHFFMDREDALASNAMSAAVTVVPTTRFDTGITSPYFGYRKARAHLMGIDLASLDFGTMMQSHTYLLSGRHMQILPSFFTRNAENSERTSSDKIGSVRDVSTNFESTDISRIRIGLTRLTSEGGRVETVPLADINGANPYLIHVPSKDGIPWFGDRVYYTPLSEWRTYRDKLSPKLIEKLETMEAKIGVIPYAEMEGELRKASDRVDAEMNRYLEREHAKLLRSLERGWIDGKTYDIDYRLLQKQANSLFADDKKAALNKVFDKHFALNSDTKAAPLVREYITEILNNRWGQLRREMAAAKTREQVIAAIASFHYDFLSIHPFANGNGRMARLLTERLLAEYGLPPPIWTHFGEDVILKKADFATLFRDSLTLSHEFHKDLGRAVHNGLPYDTVMIGTVLPGVTPKVLAEHSIDPADFMAWIAASKYYTTDVPSAVQRYLRWRELKGKKEWEMPAVKLATTAHVAEFGKLSPTADAYERRRAERDDGQPVIASSLTKSTPKLEDVLGVFSKGQLTRDPAVALTEFNAMMVRTPRLAAPWLSTSWWSGDPAAKAGVIRAFDDLSSAQAKATGSGRYRFDVWFAKPKIGSLDAKFLTDLNEAPEAKTKGVHLVAGGIEAEAIDSVVVVSTRGERLFAAKRTGFRTVEVTDFTVGVPTLKIYDWVPERGWVAR